MIKVFINSLFRRVTHRYRLARLRKRTLSLASDLVASGTIICLDIGAGNTLRDDRWITLDNNGVCDMWWDLADGIPFADNTVSQIYSSHVFEHMSPSSLLMLLRDCYRSLAPGGSISVCVPNARLFLDAYSKGRYFLNDEDERCWKRGWFNTGSLIDQINYIAYMGSEHCLMFDDSNLPSFLRLAGFHDVSLREFQDGLDLHERDYESIYAIGFKPA